MSSRTVSHAGGRVYVPARLLGAAAVLWGAFTVTFILLYCLPGDPISIMLSADGGGGGGTASAGQRQALEVYYGFDQPVIVRYAHALWRLLHGDFGISMQTGKPVLREIASVLPETLALFATSLSISILSAMAWALAAGRHRNGWVARSLLLLPAIFRSSPSFWVALILLQIFSFRLDWLPALGDRGIASLVLPAVTLAVPIVATLARVLGEALWTTWDKPFIFSLRARGLSERRIYLGHVLPNSLTAVLTVLGTTVGHIFAGTVVIETVFSRAGIGRLLQTSVEIQDLPVIQAIVLLIAFAYTAVNLGVDLLYPVLDPRLRSRRATGMTTQDQTTASSAQ